MDTTEAPAAVAEDQPSVEPEGAPSPGEETSAPPESPEYFSENFDPTQLPDELRPAYKQLQGAFTRKTQELAEQRKQAEQHTQLIQALQSDDDDLRNQALAALGYDVNGDEDDEIPFEELTPDEQFQQRLDRLEQERQQERAEREQTAQLEALQGHVESQFAEIAKAEGRQINDAEKTVLVSLASSVLPIGSNGMPDVRGAAEFLNSLRDEWQQQYVASKNAPRPATSGQPGSPQFDFENEEQRVNAMASIIDGRRS